MREKMLDKVILGLAVVIGIMIVLFIIGFVQIKMEESHSSTTTVSSSEQDGKTTTASKDNQDNDTVTDEKSAKTSAESSKKSEATTKTETTEASKSEKIEFNKSNDYILPESDTKVYTKSELSGLTKSQLAIARNEIYAKHGYIFSKNRSMKEYFEGKSWYSGTVAAKDFDESVFNQYEKKNIDLIVELEGK